MNAVLILPARNEAECIEEVIAEARQHFSGEIIVVDNGSSDDTAERAAAVGARVVRPQVLFLARQIATSQLAGGQADIRLAVVVEPGFAHEVAAGVGLAHVVGAVEEVAILVIDVIGVGQDFIIATGHVVATDLAEIEGLRLVAIVVLGEGLAQLHRRCCLLVDEAVGLADKGVGDRFVGGSLICLATFKRPFKYFACSLHLR